MSTLNAQLGGILGQGLCRENSGRGLLQSRLAGSGDLSSMQACVAECSDRPVDRC
jgi:hypothetical protein